jgi:hypothetical protein
MKKLGGTLLLLLILSGCGGGGTSEDAALQDQLARNREIQSQFESWVAQTEPYVAVQPDGTLRLDRTRAAEVSPRALDFAERAIAEANRFIATGLVTVGKDLTLQPTFLSRANENKWCLYWWGVRFWLNNTSTQRLIGLMDAGSGLSAIAAVIAAAGGASVPVTVALGVAAGLLQISVGVIEYYAAPGKGIIITKPWWPPNRVWIESQR